MRGAELSVLAMSKKSKARGAEVEPDPPGVKVVRDFALPQQEAARPQARQRHVEKEQGGKQSRSKSIGFHGAERAL